MNATQSTAPSACTSPGADAGPSQATPAAGVQTERAVPFDPFDLNAIVARKRAAGVTHIAPRLAGCYLPASPFDDIDTPDMNGRSEHAVRSHRGDATGWNEGVSW